MLNPVIDAPPIAEPPTITLAGIDIHDIDEHGCVELIVTEAAIGRGGWVITPNADIARLASGDPDLNAMLGRATLRVPDGMPLIWASRLAGTPLRGRVCGSDLVWSVAKRAAKENLSLFLLGGGQPDTAIKAASILKKQNPTLNIAGTWYPPFGFETDAKAMEAMRNALRATAPDIVYVALGFPKAERLIDELRAEFPDTWWIGVGISLSFICNEVARAPEWMQRTGLEWLHRLLQEPGRLMKRYLWHDLPFVARLLADARRARQRVSASTVRRLPISSARR